MEPDNDILKGPKAITQAESLQDSLALVSTLWKQKQSIAVHQRMLESWAIDIVYNAAGLRVGQLPTRAGQTKMKQAAQKLMPVLRPRHMQGSGDQSVIRTQYYWKLLAEFCSNGVPFIVAYRPSTVDTSLLSDASQRLRGEDVHAWVPTIKAVESHVTGWFDTLGGKIDRLDLSNSIVAPCVWASPYDQGRWNSFRHNITAHPKLLHPLLALRLAKYGYDGNLFRRKAWSVMEVPGATQSIAICDILKLLFWGWYPGS